MGRRGWVVVASRWEYEGLGFEPWQLQATSDSGLPKKSIKKYSQPYSVPLIIDFSGRTLKD